MTVDLFGELAAPAPQPDDAVKWTNLPAATRTRCDTCVAMLAGTDGGIPSTARVRPRPRPAPNQPLLSACPAGARGRRKDTPAWLRTSSTG